MRVKFGRQVVAAEMFFCLAERHFSGSAAHNSPKVRNYVRGSHASGLKTSFPAHSQLSLRQADLCCSFAHSSDQAKRNSRAQLLSLGASTTTGTDRVRLDADKLLCFKIDQLFHL